MEVHGSIHQSTGSWLCVACMQCGARCAAEAGRSLLLPCMAGCDADRFTRFARNSRSIQARFLGKPSECTVRRAAICMCNGDSTIYPRVYLSLMHQCGLRGRVTQNFTMEGFKAQQKNSQSLRDTYTMCSEACCFSNI